MNSAWRTLGVVLFWASWPLLWVYLRGTHRTRVIITSGDKVLLVKGWLSAGQWILPGGGLHRHEDTHIGASREIKEETGLDILPEQMNLVKEERATEYGIPFKLVVLRAELPAEQAVKLQKFEIVEAAWLPKNSVTNLSPLTRELLAS